mmetsp:Transcript_67572/g.187383  ORF Transcript_67572/g.187383 Transcript_67572/m.187383 type:complete len:131 (+) Transcript_67572:764-1156(+)
MCKHSREPVFVFGRLVFVVILFILGIFIVFIVDARNCTGITAGKNNTQSKAEVPHTRAAQGLGEAQKECRFHGSAARGCKDGAHDPRHEHTSCSCYRLLMGHIQSIVMSAHGSVDAPQVCRSPCFPARPC